MKTNLLLSLLLFFCTACAAKQPKPVSVQENTVSFNEVYKTYYEQCHAFPYPNVIYVDQCFEFHCKPSKFQLWDSKCTGIEEAKKIMNRWPGFFQ